MKGRSDRLLDAVLASAEVPTKVSYATRAVLNGFWLGVLSEARLADLDERYYAREGRYRDDDWNERGLFGWETALVDAHLTPGSRVAVLGAGAGREVLALRRLGHDAVGYESHPDLARAGERFLAGHGHPGALRHAPRDRFPADAEPVDAVVIGWGAYSLVHGSAARVGLLHSARGLLASGGPVLVSYLERAAPRREVRLTTAIANALRAGRRAPRLEPGDTLWPNLVHVFEPDRFDAEAAAGGFAVTHRSVIEPIEAGVVYAAAVLA